ncbi:septum formation family protein [Micromonospora echinofusca]|uniref:Septum formation-related domain-containing protein n=1 Tax=Micromonospora echinofusca TaxID=47858 RepID=A0ABS3VN89_MICEH|nr:septum formation family protein [Micromonospora echinofusca]MBO4205918.1 hypothetical protein [Micromonospora echinofusca]
MRRWSLRSLALAGAAVLLLAGCGAPGGVDGDLVDDWPAFGQPEAFTPPAGVCLAADFAETVYLSAFNPVDCTAPHRVETVHVGAFPGDPPALPAAGSAELRAAYAECDAKATGYVGGDWRAGRLWLGVALPPASAWSGGARWFRCDLTELTSVESNGEVVSRTAGLRDALKADSPLKLGCYTAKLDRQRTIEELVAASCTRPHSAEFVGAWRAPENVAYPVRDRDWARFYDECRNQIGRYVGLADDPNLRFRVGVVAVPGKAAQWKAGDRGVRCYLWLSDRTVNRSLRNAGAAALPIRTG